MVMKFQEITVANRVDRALCLIAVSPLHIRTYLVPASTGNTHPKRTKFIKPKTLPIPLRQILIRGLQAQRNSQEPVRQ